MARKDEIFKKCPKCGNREDVAVEEMVGYADKDDIYDPDTADNRYKSYRAMCPKCGFSMRRRTVQELATAWNVSKEKRVSHVKDCINALYSAVYSGGCAYIGRDAVEMWKDETGSLEKLRKHLEHKIGKPVEFTAPDDGIGLIVCGGKE